MTLQTKVFGEVTIEEEKIITFPGGIIGFPELTQFTLLHDEDDGIALEPDAVEEHDIEDLSDTGRDGPYLPYP